MQGKIEIEEPVYTLPPDIDPDAFVNQAFREMPDCSGLDKPLPTPQKITQPPKLFIQMAP